MDFQSIAKNCTSKGLQIPEMDLHGNPTNMEIIAYTRLFRHIRKARKDSYNKTKQVAEGTDPSNIPIKCYLPAHELYGTDSVFSDFRDELSVKEYMLSGMCQKCQNHVFG